MEITSWAMNASWLLTCRAAALEATRLAADCAASALGDALGLGAAVAGPVVSAMPVTAMAAKPVRAAIAVERRGRWGRTMGGFLQGSVKQGVMGMDGHGMTGCHSDLQARAHPDFADG